MSKKLLIAYPRKGLQNFLKILKNQKSLFFAFFLLLLTISNRGIQKSGGVKKPRGREKLKSVIKSILKSVGTKVTDIYTQKYLLNIRKHEAKNDRINNGCQIKTSLGPKPNNFRPTRVVFAPIIYNTMNVIWPSVGSHQKLMLCKLIQYDL